jgi:hypothetical protein
LESYIDLLDFFGKGHYIEHIDPVHLSIRLLVPPGSALLSDSDSAEWLGALDAAAYTYRWQHPDPRMDTLQQQVAALVETGETCKLDPVATVFRVKALALAQQGISFAVEEALQAYGERKNLPRLSESWFCCAEPTTMQLAPRKGKRAIAMATKG